MGDLFAGADSDEELSFKTDTQYAKKYDIWRQKEVTMKLKARYGDVGDSSTCSEEDEDGVEVTPQVEKDFFRTLSFLKKDDERLYDPNYKFFADRVVNDGQPKSGPAEKPLFIRDYERKRILEHDGLDVDEDAPAPRAESPSLVQEQREIVAAFKTALDSDSDDDLLVPRQRQPAEVSAEDKSYASWLLGNKEKLADAQAEKELKPLKDFWTNPTLAEDDAFLKDYILGKRYLEPGSQKAFEQAVSESEDEKAVDTMEQFERRFNFRFEHPDAALIQTFPRTMENSVRRKDTRRKEQRQSTKERHEARRAVQVQELMQLKALKRKEIFDRIQALKKVTGNDSLGFQDSDVEGDFDPGRHDERMRALFDEPYYQGGEGEEEKPEFPDLDEELELERWDDEDYHPEKKKKKKRRQEPIAEETSSDEPIGDETSGDEPIGDEAVKAAADEDVPKRERRRKSKPREGARGEEGVVHCEDAEFNMDADFDPTAVQGRQRRKEAKKRKRRVPLLTTALAREKPVFDPNVGTFNAFLDEYYAMDFEDIIGDMPCRFKYRQVPPNDFGLTVDEILACDDKELNMWASIKKATTLRPDWLERKDQISYARRGQNEAYKRKILTSLYQPRKNIGDESDEAAEEQRKKKKKKKGGKKMRMLGERAFKEESKRVEEETIEDGTAKKKKHRHKERDELGDEAQDKEEGQEDSLENGEIKKKKKKHREKERDELGDKAEGNEEGHEDSLENGEAKKKKKKHWHKERDELGDEAEGNEEGQEDSLENGEVKKKKKKKHRENEGDEPGDEAEGKEEGDNLENGEVKKKKLKKKHREKDFDECGDEGDLAKKEAAQEEDVILGNGEVKKKKKKGKHREEENAPPGVQRDEEGQENDLGLDNGEVKKKKKKHREGKSDEIGDERNVEQEIHESGTKSDNGEKTEKKAKKRKREETEFSQAGMQGEDQEKEIELRNGEVKKKKAKTSDAKTDNVGLGGKTAVKKKKKKKKKGGADAGKAAKPAKPKTEASGESAETSRRKKKNAKLQLKRQLEPRKVQEPAPKKKKPWVRGDYPRKPTDEIHQQFTASRLAAYGVKKPKKFLNYLKYKPDNDQH